MIQHKKGCGFASNKKEVLRCQIQSADHLSRLNQCYGSALVNELCCKLVEFGWFGTVPFAPFAEPDIEHGKIYQFLTQEKVGKSGAVVYARPDLKDRILCKWNYH